MNFIDILSLSSRTVRANKLRTGITVAIIAFGIMALIGIITAIKAMNQKFTESFSTMGANSFTLRFRERSIGFNQPRSEAKLTTRQAALKERASSQGKQITKKQAELFAQQFHFDAITSVSVFMGRSNTVSYANRKTDPNVYVFGGDEHYLELNGFTIEYGRNLTKQEISEAGNFCVLGYDVANKLFRQGVMYAVNAIVRINEVPYRVVGVMKSRGSTFGFSRDNLVVAGYTGLDKNFYIGWSYVIGIMCPDIDRVPAAMSEAEGLFRSVRRLSASEESNFVLDRSDSIAEKAMNSLRFLTISATVIGLITLIGAAIGLMNIMLVAVSERTREVGLTKALGAKRSSITWQFLTEAILISIAGAILGIILGVLVGNVFASFLDTGFVVPWNWVVYGVIICTIVGLSAGLYPALMAGKLNPIDALRYE